MTTSHLVDYCNDCIQRRLFPGCAIAFGKSNNPPAFVFAGQLTYEPCSPAVDGDTWFDLASLTKPIATVTTSMKAVEQKKLDLEASISHFFPDTALHQIQIRHLLSHSSGLPAYRPFFETCTRGDEVIKEILQIKSEYETGSCSVYSDLGFMLLGRILEIVFNLPFRTLVEENILSPLKLKSIEFGPLSYTTDRAARSSDVGPTSSSSFQDQMEETKRKIAPTELDFSLHGFARGTAHDENVRLFGGAAGHAGLFGAIGGVAQFAEAILLTATGATYKSPLREIGISAKSLQAWTQSQPWLKKSSWGLGWDTPTPDSSAGPALSKRSFGHTGFTGTSIWIDPDQDLYICILSNRVHPSRKTEGMKEARRKIHSLAIKGGFSRQ